MDGVERLNFSLLGVRRVLALDFLLETFELNYIDYTKLS